jgi:hypothetical protein
LSELTELRLEAGYCLMEGIPVPPRIVKHLGPDVAEAALLPRDRYQTRQIDKEGIPRWGQSPETKIPLPGLGGPTRTWGLSLRRMHQWWQTFKASAPHYQALGFQNCAGVALLALQQGGADAFLPAPGVTIYAEPLQVEHYATELRAQFDRLEGLVTEFQADFANAPQAPAVGLVDGLWPLVVWKQQSALGALQVRSNTIRTIDDALETYHRTDWNSGFRVRYKALVTAFFAVMQHRLTKADSARSTAVLRLGAQILGVANNLA